MATAGTGLVDERRSGPAPALALVPPLTGHVTLLRRRTLSPEDVIDELLRRAGQGDEVAFARLYDVMIPLVLCVARLLTGPAEVEALAERACIDVWRMSPGYPGSGVGPLSWIAALVEHAAS